MNVSKIKNFKGFTAVIYADMQAIDDLAEVNNVVIFPDKGNQAINVTELINTIETIDWCATYAEAEQEKIEQQQEAIQDKMRDDE